MKSIEHSVLNYSFVHFDFSKSDRRAANRWSVHLRYYIFHECKIDEL